MGGLTIKGRTVVVTGASRGIGRALVHILAARGAARVIAVGRDRTRLKNLQETAPVVVPYVADLSGAAAVQALVSFIKREAPDTSMLINNAGSQLLTELVDPESDRHMPALAEEVALNLSAPIQLTAGLMPLLMGQRSAMVVNVTSGLAIAPKQSAPVYCAAKAGLRSFTKALRYQAEARAPQVQIVEALPPLVDTDMTRGRGKGKMSAEDCAAEIVAGMEAGKARIYVGKAKLLRAIHGLSPSFADRVMRRG